MSRGGTTWASLGRRDERKKDDPLKRAVVGGEIKTKEKKRLDKEDRELVSLINLYKRCLQNNASIHRETTRHSISYRL